VLSDLASRESGTPALPDLSTVSAQRFEQANALSGLSFAADGKLYAAGELNVIDESKAAGDTAADKYRTSISGHKLVVARFNADAKPDESFGEHGFVTWEGPAGEASAMSLALTDDNSVVVAVNLKYPSKHALMWIDQSEGSLVDAITLPTRSNHQQPVEASWDCRDQSQQLVAAGTYRVNIEFTEAEHQGPALTGGRAATVQLGTGPSELTRQPSGSFGEIRITLGER
jgi:hypothetical protein